MKNVKDVLNDKGSVIFSVKPDATVFDALGIMMDKNISALLVMEANSLKGIFTERDYARKIVLKGKSSKDTSVSDIMTSDLISVSLTDSIDHCMNIMTEKTHKTFARCRKQYSLWHGVYRRCGKVNY